MYPQPCLLNETLLMNLAFKCAKKQGQVSLTKPLKLAAFAVIFGKACPPHTPRDVRDFQIKESNVIIQFHGLVEGSLLSQFLPSDLFKVI